MFSIVLPCYNEAENLELILKKFEVTLKNNFPLEVVIVNNGSTDTTSLILRKLVLKYPFITVVTIKKNLGYGHGIYSGLKKAKGHFIGWTHADLQTDPVDVIRAFKKLARTQHPLRTLVKGTRKKRNVFDNFFTVGMSIFESIYLGTTLWDINAQPNVFHKSLLLLLKNPPKDFSFDLYTLYIAKKNNFSIVRIPVFFSQRLYGNSKWNTGIASKINFIKRTLTFSRALKSTLLQKAAQS
jgi:polyisoprenyl-phosphate glycosyltransferase